MEPIYHEAILVLPEFACPHCGNNDASQIFYQEISQDEQGRLNVKPLRCGRCGKEYEPEDECPDRG